RRADVHIVVANRGDGKGVPSAVSGSSIASQHARLKGMYGFARDPHALPSTSGTGQGHDQDSLQAWRQGCTRTGRARPARAEFDPGKGALNCALAASPALCAHLVFYSLVTSESF